MPFSVRARSLGVTRREGLWQLFGHQTRSSADDLSALMHLSNCSRCYLLKAPLIAVCEKPRFSGITSV
eukprot:6188390-Pleurochrysis_carterae.AAC.2